MPQTLKPQLDRLLLLYPLSEILNRVQELAEEYARSDTMHHTPELWQGLISQLEKTTEAALKLENTRDVGIWQ